MNRSIPAALIALVAINVLTLGVVGALWARSASVEERLTETRAEMAQLSAGVGALERGVPLSELSMRLGELENEIQEWVVAFSGDIEPGSIAAADAEELLDRLEEIQREIERLNDRLDEICEGVPIC